MTRTRAPGCDLARDLDRRPVVLRSRRIYPTLGSTVQIIEFYPQIKATHIAAVMASGLLFFLRGVSLSAGMKWGMAAPVRYLSYAIDTVLLTAALLLVAIVHQYPFVHAWLTMKVLLLVVYIVLGTFALKRGSTKQIRAICWLAALLVYAFIVSVARTHNPAGVFSGMLS